MFIYFFQSLNLSGDRFVIVCKGVDNDYNIFKRLFVVGLKI